MHMGDVHKFSSFFMHISIFKLPNFVKTKVGRLA